MARYIDADKIDYTITMVGRDENAGYRAVAFESDIDQMPTADVVPRSEIAREIFDEIKKCVVLKVIKDGEVIFDRSEQFAELKKKYTEGNNV